MTQNATLPPGTILDRPDAKHFDAFTRRLHALYPLNPEEITEFTSLIEDISVVAGNEHILREQQSSKEALVLLEGMACHYRMADTARRQMTGFVLPGDFCDHGFLSSIPVRQSVLSVGQVVVGRIDLSRLANLGRIYPNVIVAAMRAASIEQACSRELAVSLGARDALKRMAHFLCEMYERLRIVGLVSGSGQFILNMTQAELGEALGLSTVHVNRTIQQLRRSKRITWTQGDVTIPDIAALAALATFDGRYLRS